MTCTMNTRQHELEYNPIQLYEKDITEFDALAMSGEPILKQKIKNDRRLTLPEKAILDKCHDNCIYPVENSFFKMSMGGDNNMEKCIPDLLHVFSGGIIKSFDNY